MKIVIDGVPCPKGRPRFAVRGGFARAYTPAKTRSHEEVIRHAGIEAMNGLEPLTEALRVTISFFMPIPKSTSKKDRQLMIDGDIQHIKKPDVDNMAKLVCDSLNEVAWVDDSQIVRMVASKHYSDYPRTEIEIEEFKR